ncbi:unnamed protein product [Prorocentrum cordatum]|uniref:Pectin acetylesterase n=1 Tax=Prorocentrum cordatum TaxID=2364126 RepID=A0ABN9QSD6_9DINO|nr:unnamed protein product [Polarella glacialis]
MVLPRVTALLLGSVSVVSAAATPGDPFPPAVAGGGWQWVPMPGSKCMDGQGTGVYIRRGHSDSTKLAVYLNGGGACFDTATCMMAATNPQPGKPGDSGIFSTDEMNPLHDFNWINVPYCTGDVHLGAAENQVGGAHRYFHGHANLQLIAARAVASWPKLETLLVTGESAGGFGALASYAVFRERWTAATGNSDLRALLLDDSGPIMDDAAIPVCLQQIWRESWNINASLAAGCPSSAARET